MEIEMLDDWWEGKYLGRKKGSKNKAKYKRNRK